MKFKSSAYTPLAKDISIKNARISLSSIFFLYGIIFAAWASRIPDIKVSLKLSDPQLGGILLAMPIGTVLSLLISGGFIAKQNIKTIITISFILLNLSMIGLGIPNSSISLFISLFLFGFFGNALNVAINTQAIEIQKKIGKTIMSSFHAIYSVGFMVSVAVGGAFSKYGITPVAHFAILTGFNLLSLLFFIKHLLNSHDKEVKKNVPAFTFITSDKMLWLLGLIVFCGVLSEGTLIDWAAVYYRQTISNSIEDSAAAFTAFSIAMMVGRFSGDYLANKFNPINILICSGMGLCLGMLISLIYLNSYFVFIGYVLMGLSISNIVPITYSLTGQLSKKTTAIAISTIATIGYVGILLGPALIGFLSGILTLRGALSIISLLGLVVFTISMTLKKT